MLMVVMVVVEEIEVAVQALENRNRLEDYTDNQNDRQKKETSRMLLLLLFLCLFALVVVLLLWWWW